LLFNSLEFVIFLPVVLLVYYQLPHKWQNRFLLVASCVFYAAWDWRFLFPLLASTSIDYWCAKRMEALGVAGAPREKRRPYVVLSVVTNLSLLGFFKYFNFFYENFQALAAGLGFHPRLTTLEIVLPIGISFYTFQALSYTIDVYRGHFHPTNSFFDFLLAVLYFPHLVAGPIQRAASLIPQVMKPRQVTREQIIEGIHLIAWGYFKKVFIADNVSPVADRMFNLVSPDGWQTMIAVYAFAVQIYCDFSGYTDIARGSAKLMGFEFVLNFNLPYLATNPSDFWKRWHISLSSWLRDYLYIPLGGNRGSRMATYRNLMLTMIIGGFWHGAAWNFLLWGFYHGLLLVVHRLLEPAWRIFDWPGVWGRRISFLLRMILFFQLTCYGWLLFRARSFAQIFGMTASLFRPWQVDWTLAQQLLPYALPLIVVQVFQYLTGKLHFLDWPHLPAEVRVVVYSVFLYCVLFRGGMPQSFIYFQF